VCHGGGVMIEMIERYVVPFDFFFFQAVKLLSLFGLEEPKTLDTAQKI